MKAVSVDELASAWDVSVSDLEQEILAGRLRAFSVNGQRRVPLTEAERFIEQALQAQPSNGTVSPQDLGTEADTAGGWKISLSPGSSFPHVWPDGTKEEYKEAYEGAASDGTRQARVRIGFTHRKAAGQNRRRAVVFIDQRPLVEFVGGNDFENTYLMASIIKDRNDRHVVAPEMVPSEYQGFDVHPFRQVVSGPYASHGYAVVIRSEDRHTMVRHALIRAAYKSLLG